MNQINCNFDTMLGSNRRDRGQIFIAAFIILAGIVVTLFRHWEFSGESWGYWFFARIFAQTGKFIVVDRSPFYILYLNIFRWIGYPWAVIVEYIVTSLILAVSLMILLRRHIGLFLAVFAVIIWMPFFQVAEPPVQKLALACSCLAITLRDIKVSRFRLAVSYALLGFAYLFRGNYIVFILVFAVWDGIKFLRQKNLKGFIACLRPKRSDWPILVVLALLIWINVMQSPHPWNNVWFTSTTWFPNKGKKMIDAAFAQNYNWSYISNRYGTFKDKDFYFTNQEVFGGAGNAIEAIRANPRFVVGQIARNAKAMISKIIGFTMVPHFYKKFSSSGYLYYFIVLLFMSFVFAIFYGAWRACKREAMILFFIANISLLGTVIIVMPKSRYLFPLIPILILSAFWYGKRIYNILKKKQVSSVIAPRALLIIGHLVVLSLFILFSNGLSDWRVIIADFAKDISKGEIRVMESRPYSLKASFKALKPLVQNCNGVLSLESEFFGAFMDIPISSVYDIWEIPPFGNLGNSDYNGLHPERIDCLLISNSLAESIGCATNSQIRYQNYITPYAKQLQDKGAASYDIKEYGRAVVLK